MSTKARNIIIAVVAVVAAVIVVAMATAKPDVTPAPQSATAVVATPTPAGPKLTSAQQQAVRAADGYQAFMYYSRQGLIDQLVTFDHFDRKDATVAVDSQKYDWNDMAVKKAQQYLSGTGFSKNGLTTQLVRWDKYTKDQAKQAVQKAFDSAE